MRRHRRSGPRLLAEALDGQMKHRARRPPVIDLATIGAGLVLELDGFGVPIPAGDYLVCEALAADPLTGERAGGVGDPEFAAHSHPARPLEVGDRVLVAMLDNDSDAVTPVVIDRVMEV